MKVFILLWVCAASSVLLFVAQVFFMTLGTTNIPFGVLAAMCQMAAAVMFAWGIHVSHDLPQARRWLLVGQGPLWVGVFLLLGSVPTVQFTF